MSSCKAVILGLQIQQAAVGFLSKAVAETDHEFTSTSCATSPSSWPSTSPAPPPAERHWKAQSLLPSPSSTHFAQSLTEKGLCKERSSQTYKQGKRYQPAS